MRQKEIIILFIFLFFCGKSLFAMDDMVEKTISIDNFSVSTFVNDSLVVDIDQKKPAIFKRGKAILFTIFTGILGGHRIYLGTHQRTPILYSITLGGLGILPVIDLFHIIFTKDLSRYENVPQIIMWGRIT